MLSDGGTSTGGDSSSGEGPHDSGWRAAITPAVVVRVDGVDVSGLCDAGLRSRLGEIGRAESRLASVIAATERQLYHHEDPKSRPTPVQRTADAVAKLICEPDGQRPTGTSLLVMADYDMVNHQLANTRFADGTPIPISEIARIAVDAQILPAIFDDATGDLRMGRSRRTAMRTGPPDLASAD